MVHGRLTAVMHHRVTYGHLQLMVAVFSCHHLSTKGGRHMEQATQIMDDTAIRRSLTRMAHEILERNRGLDNVVLVGILTRGVVLAQRVASKLEEIEGQTVECLALDARPYRDDRDHGHAARSAETPDLQVADRKVVLVDDVLYTGRTVRAALDAIMQAGRAQAVQLATLVDRGHRELPIRPDFIGKNVPTGHTEQVIVKLREVDGEDGVWITSRR